MADQPLNQDIQIFRTVRGQREILRHDSVKNIIGKLRRLILVEPGCELRTEYGTRSTTVTDFSPFMGMAAAGATRGLPITVDIRTAEDFSCVDDMTGIDFPVEIGSDKFVMEDSLNVGGDIQEDARNA